MAYAGEEGWIEGGEGLLGLGVGNAGEGGGSVVYFVFGHGLWGFGPVVGDEGTCSQGE